jgi:chromosome segregation protein
MKLKKIKLVGFKSFVDSTTVYFNSNRIAIVGPNGCGKSNIIDAVRWVMGESSAKQMRGENMSDVIFNGSNNRKPVGQASVELIFDNTDTTLTGEYAKYAEIAIRREICRDGVSNYYLNGVHCRRRDIVDIFLGTGLGPHSYAIIEQGTISQLIEAKPDEMRIFMEEAAGISKYRERRKETESRIAHTRDNLARLQDIRQELESQLRHLKRQSNAANRYKMLKQEDRQLRAYLEGLYWITANNQCSELGKVVSQQETEIEGKLAEITKLNALFEQLSNQRIESNMVFNDVQSQFYNLGAEISRTEQQIAHTKDRQTQLNQDLQQAEEMLLEIKQHTAKDQQTLASSNDELSSFDGRVIFAKETLGIANINLVDAENAMNQWQNIWDEFNSQMAQSNQQFEVGATQITHLEYDINNIKSRLYRLQEEQTSLKELVALQEEATLLQENYEQLKVNNDRFKRELADKREQINITRDLCNDLSSTIDAARQELQKLQGKHSSLEALQQAALGKHDVHINNWLQNNQLSDRPRLAQELRVASGWEKAVETVLNTHLDAVCVDHIDNIINQLETLQQGNITLFATKMTNKAIAVGPETLASKVQQANLSVNDLLAHIYVADNLSQALNLRSKLKSFESVITQDGVWLGSAWVCLNLGQDAKSGILQREQAMQEVIQQIDAQQNTINEQEQEFSQSKINLNNLEQQYESLQQRFNEANAKHSEIYGDLTAKRARIDHLQKRSAILDQESNELSQKLVSCEKQLATLVTTQEKVKENKSQHEEHRRTLLIQRDACRDNLLSMREQAATAKKAVDELEIGLKFTHNQIQYLTQSLQRAESQMKELNERQNKAKQDLIATKAPLVELAVTLETFLQKRSTVDKELATAKQKIEQVDSQLRELDQNRNILHEQEQKMRGKLEQTRVEAKALQTRGQGYTEKISELGFELPQVLQSIPDGTEISMLEEQIGVVNKRIDRLGPINLAAIEEYDQKLERKTYLDAQNNDLVEALTTLENAIAKIDQETKERFRDTYTRVNEEFQRFFPIIFGGGKATLEMTENDLLDTGITISAQPPGKRNSTIHLLSGGEKALTAVALVFAIFQLNPAPFCMLDEVDAPLDDSNTIKFCNLVKEMANKTQFVVVSHNKITMEMAEQLAGVTMQEQGVSRLVEVDIEEARSWAE